MNNNYTMKQSELFNKKVSIQLSYNQQNKAYAYNKTCKVKKYGMEFIIAYNDNEELRAYYQGMEVIDLEVKEYC